MNPQLSLYDESTLIRPKISGHIFGRFMEALSDSQIKLITHAFSKLNTNASSVRFDPTEAVPEAEVRKNIETISSRSIVIEHGSEYQFVPILNSARIINSSSCELEFNKDALAFLKQISLNDEELKVLREMEGNQYAYNLFLLLKEIPGMGERQISLYDLRDRLCIDNKYNRFTDLKLKILQPVQEGFRQSRLAFDFFRMAVGNKPVGIVIRRLAK